MSMRAIGITSTSSCLGCGGQRFVIPDDLKDSKKGQDEKGERRTRKENQAKWISATQWNTSENKQRRLTVVSCLLSPGKEHVHLQDMIFLFLIWGVSYPYVCYNKVWRKNGASGLGPPLRQPMCACCFSLDGENREYGCG